MAADRGPAALPGLRAFRNPTFRFLCAVLLAAAAVLGHLFDVVNAWQNWTATAHTTVTADFNSWMTSGRLLLGGGSPYLPFTSVGGEAFIAGPTHLPYPPTFLLLLSPWVLAPEVLRFASWMLVEELALAALVAATWAGLGRPTRTELAISLALVLPFLPVRQNLFEGQVNVVTAALAALAVLGWQRRRAGAGGLSLAVAVALKPTAGLAGAFFAYRRGWRLLAWSAAALVVLAGGSLLAGWGSSWLPFLRLLAPLGRGSAFIANQSVNGVLLRAWHPEFAGEPISALPPALVVAWYAAEALAVVVVVAGLRRLRLPEPEAAWVQFAVISELLVLLQPLAWFHHHVGAVVMIVVAVRLASRRMLSASAGLVLAVAYAVVTFVAYPIHLAARPYGGAGLYGQPWLRAGTSAAFCALLTAVLVLAWLRPAREATAMPVS